MQAPAKINLYLHITGKRPDGYHLLDSFIIFTNVHDVIDIEESLDLSLEVKGEFASQVTSDEGNIVLKAARSLAQAADLEDSGAKISLTKNIPVGAGLGGGSADAAATLKLLNDLWQLNFSMDKLMEIGLKLGTDVPVCLAGKAAFVSAIGEVIEPAGDLPELFILLVNPGQSLSTIEVYRNNKKIVDSVVEDRGFSKNDFIAFLQGKRNDLTDSAAHLLPEISEVLSLIKNQQGSFIARMSGSGSTCFGLFDTEENLSRALAAIKEEKPDWWVAIA